MRRALPGVPAVACFDTAFHATLPRRGGDLRAAARAGASAGGVRRYGFHGLSHAYAARRAAELRARRAARIVTCHLGAGASLAAVRDGRSVDTTMGFTPLEGLVMATRSGSVDPGLLLWLLEHGGLEPASWPTALEHESGLLGAGRARADMREVLAPATTTTRRALALDVYVHRLRAGDRRDGGRARRPRRARLHRRRRRARGRVRARAAGGLGVPRRRARPARNAAARRRRRIGAAGAAVRTLVVAAREDLEIARQVRARAGLARCRPHAERKRHRSR